MAFRAAGRTDVGLVRKENQDDYLILPRQALYAVADGMGGHAGGKQASAVAIGTLRGMLDGRESVDEAAVEEALAAANANILQEAKEKRLEGMGTTLVLTFYAGDRWRVAHIGDSRAYLISGEGIRALTKDHSLVGELVARGSITPEEAKSHPHRNVLTRALGTPGNPGPEWNYTGEGESGYLLLCSDGLHNMLEEETIRDIVLSSGLSLEEKAAGLVDEANRSGGPDNITVILIAREDVP